ncbi:FAD/NAD(P)-binding protein [Gellertiella hungarica]|uniref:Putative NAD(P)/FAD-binding protein YdhS n=1 Tax=Gellertiella hungarica TaxID=1572859 RepID=A0A7W6NJ08_9HYPH|nr:FAD/NAD(P)-binding protein [Gellertiella hungarica]MBB4063860.1 putative NAD(P)/FAD-binding protein YdhS [Gellertiella hungarica]
MTISERNGTVVLTVAIVGGGLTGAAVALHLRNSWKRPQDALEILVYEPRAEIGRGLAYDTTDGAHRVNVPVGKMSLDPQDEGAFERWFFAEGEDRADPGALAEDGRTYPRREAFGRYVHARLLPHLRAGRIRHVQQRVERVGFESGHYVLGTVDGGEQRADVLVVATSHPPPSPPARLSVLGGDGRFIADPTRPDALDGIGPEDRVLVVGSGLTAADVIASLDAAGHRGAITVFSRRGLRSRGHALETQAPRGDFVSRPATTAAALVRRVRTEVRAAAAEGIGWQAVFDALRAQGGQIWRALPLAERQRFVRHLRPFWDVHRFRIAPQVRAVADRLTEEGRLRFLAASLAHVDYAGPQSPISVGLRLRNGGAIDEADYDAIVVTTGPAHRSVLAGQPYLQSLNGLGLLRLDDTGLGLACSDNSRALDLWGAPVPGLYIAGPLARGTFGELMGLPQVNEHAVLVAGEIRRELEKRLSWLAVQKPALSR